MATITMRDLVRDSKRVFDTLETEKRPIVVTRNGRPFAALMPIDQAQAEALLLASTSEFVNTQRDAERVIAKGEATPLADALREAEEALSQATDRGPQAPDFSQSEPDGFDLADDIAETTEHITRSTANSMWRATPDSEFDENWYKRIHELNLSLVKFTFQDELKRSQPQGIMVAGQSGRAVVQREKNAREKMALATATSFVSRINSTLLLNAIKASPNEAVETFESELRGGVIFVSNYISATENAAFAEGQNSPDVAVSH